MLPPVETDPDHPTGSRIDWKSSNVSQSLGLYYFVGLPRTEMRTSSQFEDEERGETHRHNLLDLEIAIWNHHHKSSY